MKGIVLRTAMLLLMSVTGIQASADSSTDTTMAKLSQKFSTVDEAAKAIWASWGGNDVCSTYVDGPIPGNPKNFYRVSFFTPDHKFRHGLEGIIVAEGEHFRVVPKGAEPSQEFSTVDEAARAVWSARVGKGDYATYVLGPIPGDWYEVYFLTPDYKSSYGSATILVEGKHFRVPLMGGYFFHRSGKAEGIFNQSLYDKTKVGEYLADRRPEIGHVKSIRLVQSGVSVYPWLWEISSDAQTYYLYVVDHKGTAQLMTKAELDQVRAADTVRVDSLIIGGTLEKN